MKINFDLLPDPEPSSLVGFSQNRLIRDSENRTEDCLSQALENPKTRFFLFSQGQVIVNKSDAFQLLFKSGDIAPFHPQFESSILLGNASQGPCIALTCDVNTETLAEPWTSHDLRTLLYSNMARDDDAGAVAQAGAMLYWHRMNRYCGKCGTPSDMKIGGYRRDCPNCGYKIFPRTDPVVIMLPIQGEHCVLGRSPHFPEGWFSTLAGFIEPGETIEDAVRRETLEESGISVGRVKYHASQPWPFPHSLMIGIHCEAVSNKIHFDGKELEDCRWFSRKEVQYMINETHPDGLRCSPNRAISSALIRHWAA